MAFFKNYLNFSKIKKSKLLYNKFLQLEEELNSYHHSGVDIFTRLNNMLKKKDRMALCLYAFGDQLCKYCFNFPYPEIGTSMAHICVLYNVDKGIPGRLRAGYIDMCGKEVVLLFQRCLEIASILISKSISLEPYFAQAYYSKGILHYYMVEPEIAKPLFKQAFKLWFEGCKPDVYTVERAIKDCDNLLDWVNREFKGLADSFDPNNAYMVRWLIDRKSESLKHVAEVAEEVLRSE